MQSSTPEQHQPAWCPPAPAACQTQFALGLLSVSDRMPATCERAQRRLSGSIPAAAAPALQPAPRLHGKSGVVTDAPHYYTAQHLPL